MRSFIALLVVSGGALVTTEALAEPTEGDSSKAATEPVAPPGTILAPNNALELQFNAGYTQPFGELTQSVGMSDVGGPGFVGGGALAWRLTPRFAVVGFGGFHHLVGADAIDGGMVFGGAGGVAADFHFRPFMLVDPYLTVGAGYRLLFVAPGNPTDNHMFHGFEALKANFGVDFRTSDSFAIGPIIGADVNVLPWDLNTTTGENSSIGDAGVNTFFFTGIAGKLDLLGTRVPQHRLNEPVAFREVR